MNTKLVKTEIFSERDVNDCQAEEAEKCWEITPAIMAGEETVLNNTSFLRALGEVSTICHYSIYDFLFTLSTIYNTSCYTYQ